MFARRNSQSFIRVPLLLPKVHLLTNAGLLVKQARWERVFARWNSQCFIRVPLLLLYVYLLHNAGKNVSKRGRVVAVVC